ncbi:hypothetical protein QQY24_09315 [Streptomyces sp. TG1A-8]|uniref:hypothetical protein n=1 Tax=Streptomyces sp. TG1A-8 TaxID=3051385 RepID=UPI00265C8A1C|nr:hypothetical protein [Streptomyces sp. TG1A-8]MDO0925596.1 hypothetical protein [Streptomyces sp. TG1A-8]
MATKTDDVTRTDDEQEPGAAGADATGAARAAAGGAEPHRGPAGDAAEEAGTGVGAEAGNEAGAGAADAGSGEREQSGVGQGAGAVVSAALGLVSLTGGWIGTVAAARETLVGQLRTSTTAGVATQIKEVYGDAWRTTALWAGLFAVLALITGVVVLVRPAFGTPGRPQAAWIKSVAWAGVSLGVVGLLLAVLKYSGALLGLPSAG